MLVREAPLAAETVIAIMILRNGGPVCDRHHELAQMKPTPEELVGFLYREMSFPKGAILLTGTGIIPPDEFTLQSGDEVAITVEPIGTLRNGSRKCWPTHEARGMRAWASIEARDAHSSLAQPDHTPRHRGMRGSLKPDP